MGYGKWISGAIGWAVAGPLGAVLGYAVGSIFEKGAGISSNEAKKSYSQTEERNSFLVSLLVLSSAVMKADGKILKSELSYVKGFLVQNFGPDAGKEALLYLRDLLNKDVEVSQVCTQVRSYMAYEARVQLLHYLTGIARVDGAFTVSELSVLKQIAFALGISSNETESLFAMFDNGLDAAYKVLEITREATDDQVKKAYRKLAVKHHPDKVSHLGPDVQKAAEERFKKLSEAYDAIRKERNMN
ncbi:MAG: DnaJ domain-containing protein [Bacteroidales bacterium]|jgi:DnaJ like chaperone protein|nr:DnaJ domain-containing protein [Bacteroidales bacterium]MDD3300619.1 DnaJ domain-containing protein [Bacteroidales bacterium]MDD3843975.1 DnaJ domain-containing protein [Bacteroidales bacterium]MDD4618619.1 DnaJ domain-containing protein [Bacteroidales bacterium]